MKKLLKVINSLDERYFTGILMNKRASSNMKRRTATNEVFSQFEVERKDKIMNSIVNTTVLLMGTTMGAFTQIMVNATGALASGMTEAFGENVAVEKVNSEINQKLPEVEEKMNSIISGIRKDIYSQLALQKQEIESLLSDPIFEIGPKIIEKYDFKLPRLTQKLSDNTLAQYSQMLVNEDKNFVTMFKELMEWISSLPKPPKSD
jgi:hypothetical protein